MGGNVPFHSTPRYIIRPAPVRSLSQEFPTTVTPNLTPEDEERLRIVVPPGTNMIAGVGMNNSSPQRIGV